MKTFFSKVFPWLILFMFGFFLVQQIDVFGFVSDFPFVDLKWKQKQIVKDQTEIDVAKKRIKRILTRENLLLTEMFDLYDKVDSLQELLRISKTKTAKTVMVLHELFEEDSANTRLEYRKRMQWFGWIPDIPTGPLTFRETGIGAVLFEKHYGLMQDHKLTLAELFIKDTVISKLNTVLDGRYEIQKEDSIIIVKLKSQKDLLHYPYRMEITGGVKTLFFDGRLIPVAFGEYKYLAINTNRFELYMAGEGNYSQEGVGGAIETGITYKFGN